MRALSAVVCISLHLLVLSLVSVLRSRSAASWLVPATRALGTFTALWTLCVPSNTGLEDPFYHCALRVVCFFYACKLLDLSVTRANRPPQLYPLAAQVQTSQAEVSTSLRHHAGYVWLLLTEMRYHSFDIVVTQKDRMKDRAGKRPFHAPWFWHWGLPTLIVISTYCFPFGPTKCALVLLLIRLGLEAFHTLLHYRCPNQLFFEPFAAISVSEFWSNHWHACASPFLHSLAYRPASIVGRTVGGKMTGKALGVLAVFSLSGVWHAWAAMILAEDGYEYVIALRVWIFFVGMGFGCLVEQALGRSKDGGVVQWIVVWTYSLTLAAWAFGALQCHTKVAWLRKSECTR